MGNRQRLTWDKGAAASDKEASPPPQIPANDRTEKSEHPAAQPDPDYAKYKEGDPSAWAEDVHPGPYDTAAAPATPGYREPADHPAAKPGKPMSASDQSEEEIRRATELKAAKCIRVAAVMLGDVPEGVDEEKHVLAIESQALDLMDLPDDHLQSTLERLGMADDEESDKEASMDITARLDRLESGLERIAEKMGIAGNLFGQMDEPIIEEPMEEDLLETPLEEEDAMLEEMLAQDEPVVEEDAMLEEMLSQDDDDLDDDEEEMLAAMLCGRTAADEEEEKEEDKEGGKKAKKGEDDEDEEADEDKESACKKAEEEEKKEEKEPEEKEASLDIQLEDPMGLMDTSAPDSDTDLELLYRTAEDDEDKGGKPEKGKIPSQFEKKDKDEEEGKKEEDKAEEKEEEAQDEGEKEGGKKKGTDLRPQPKEPSTGAQALGTVQKSASSEVSDLSSLWEHAPDVSSVFK